LSLGCFSDTIAPTMSIAERSGPNHEERQFWSHDVAFAEGDFFGEPFTIRGRVHIGDEMYRGRNDAEIVGLNQPQGRRHYVLSHAYILVPDISLEVDLDVEPGNSGGLGEVKGAVWEGMTNEQVGSGQAWMYPADRVLVLWEYALHSRYANPDVLEDRNLKEGWLGFERFLLERFPETDRIVTPAWEPGVDHDVWREFLSELRYRELNERAYVKEARRP
jgi:hypothetical protein